MPQRWPSREAMLRNAPGLVVGERDFVTTFLPSTLPGNSCGSRDLDANAGSDLENSEPLKSKRVPCWGWEPRVPMLACCHSFSTGSIL
jgi:hypothetical protein